MAILENAISFVARGKRRKEVLQILKTNRLSQPEIMHSTKMYKEHTSRTLKELTSHKLIVCINPEDRNLKFYKLTSKGIRVLEYLKRIN